MYVEGVADHAPLGDAGLPIDVLIALLVYCCFERERRQAYDHRGPYPPHGLVRHHQEASGHDGPPVDKHGEVHVASLASARSWCHGVWVWLSHGLGCWWVGGWSWWVGGSVGGVAMLGG